MNAWRIASEKPLGVYLQNRHRRLWRLKRAAAWVALTVTAFFYGLIFAFFPPQIYTLLAVPLVVGYCFVLWALPDSQQSLPPVVRKLFVGYLISLFLWPSYLAIAIPVIPWITSQRLFLIPLGLIFLYNLATSPALRSHLNTTLWTSKTVWVLMIAFIAVQILTTPFSTDLSATINRMIIDQLAWTVVFCVSCIIFQDKRVLNTWFTVLMISLAVVVLEAALEFRLQRLPWQGHIPGFLKADPGYLEADLRTATGWYRLKGMTVHPLVLAELMATSAPFVAHAIVTVKHFSMKIAACVLLLGMFLVIIGTDSRLGVLGFFVSLLIYGGLWSVRRWRHRSRDILGPALIAGYVLGAFAFFALALTWNRLHKMIFGGGAQQASDAARHAQWQALWPKLAQWPLGHGPGNSGSVLGYVNSGGVATVDSYVISVLLDYGVIGFVAFYGMFIVAVVQSGKLAIENPDDRASMLMPIAATFFSFMVIKTVLSQEQNHSFIFMLLGMFVALRYSIVHDAAAKPLR